MIAKYPEKLVFLFILLAQVCFSQKVFKIKEGQLQFINADKGVFIKKDKTYFHLQLQDVDDYEKMVVGFKYELEETTEKEIEKIKKDASTISVSEIITSDFKNLESQKFITKNNIDDDNYQFYKYNKNFFVVSILEDSLKNQTNEYLLHYCILDFGANKKIIYHPKGFIIPTKKNTRFLFDENDLNDSYTNYESIAYKNLKAIDMQLANGNDLKLNEDFYKIDTLKNKKLRIKNLYNEKVLKESFDSITSNDYFIVAYKGKEMEIYNYAFKKFNLKNIRAFNFARFYPNMQVIEGNTLKRINLIGENYKKEDLSYETSGAPYFPDGNIGFEIQSENDHFYIYTGQIGSLTINFSEARANCYPLYNREGYETIQYADEGLNMFTSYSEMMGTTMSYPVYLYTKLKNGKFNLTTLDYLITENPDKKMEIYNSNLPKNCDSITLLDQQSYRIEKDGLFTFYPIMKEIKYKKLDEFKGKYVRFELPNGQQGWLDLKGNEYLDN